MIPLLTCIAIHGNLLRTHCRFHNLFVFWSLKFSWHLEDACDHPISWTKLRQLSVVGTRKDKKKEYQIFFCKDINYFCDLAIIILEVSVKTYLICFPGRCFSVLECRPRVWILSHTFNHAMQSTCLSNSYSCSVVI